MPRKPILPILVALLFFALHFGLILHHTYYRASQRNTKTFTAPRQYPQPQRWHNFLDLNRWDSWHYEQIVKYGYDSRAQPSRENNRALGNHDARPRPQSRLSLSPQPSAGSNAPAADSKSPPARIMWYPGYPLLAKFLSALTSWKISAIFSLLSTLFTLAFWLLLWSPRLNTILGSKVLFLTSVFILIWPGGFYWFAGMTEPVVSFFLLLLFYWCVNSEFNKIALLLSYATAVKQVFIPISGALFALQWLRTRPRWTIFIRNILLSLGGFIAFSLYSWWRFDDFFASSHTCIIQYQKIIALSSLVNLNHYAQQLPSRGGLVAFGSLFFLGIMAVKLLQKWEDIWQIEAFWRMPQRDISWEFTLWWLAGCCTLFYILGDAYGRYPFMSIFRFQTTNIFIFILLANYFRASPWWQILCWLIPLGWIALYWQTEYTVMYWLVKWLA
jgi:hypothetical protein